MSRVPLIALLALLLVPAAQAEVPMRDPTLPYSQQPIQPAGEETLAEGEAPLTLEGTFTAPWRRIAVINGEQLEIGGEVAGAKVNGIFPGRVILARNGETIELEQWSDIKVNQRR